MSWGSRFSLHGVQTPARLGLCRELPTVVVPDRWRCCCVLVGKPSRSNLACEALFSRRRRQMAWLWQTTPDMDTGKHWLWQWHACNPVWSCRTTITTASQFTRLFYLTDKFRSINCIVFSAYNLLMSQSLTIPIAKATRQIRRRSFCRAATTMSFIDSGEEKITDAALWFTARLHDIRVILDTLDYLYRPILLSLSNTLL